MKRGRWILLIILVVIIGSVGFALISNNRAQSTKSSRHDTNTYVIKKPASKAYRAQYVSTGFTSLTKIPSDKLLVNDGDQVVKGQKLATNWTTAPVSGIFSDDQTGAERIYNSPGVIQFNVSENERSNFYRTKAVDIQALTDQRTHTKGTIKSVAVKPVTGGGTALSEYKVTVTPTDQTMVNSLFFGQHLSIKVASNNYQIPQKYVTKANQAVVKRPGSNWAKTNLQVEAVNNGYYYVNQANLPVGTELKQP